MKKRHILFVISEEPINAWDIEKQNGVQHFINAELELSAGCDGDNLIIEKAIPAQTKGNRSCVYRGMGAITPLAIVDFLRSVFGSVSYESLRSRKKREEERKKEKSGLLMKVRGIVQRTNAKLEFRLPQVGEKVFMEGFAYMRLGFGTVKAVFPDSEDEKFIVTVHEENEYDVTYTFNEDSSDWECGEDIGEISRGSRIGVYTVNEKEIDPSNITTICPPTEAAREYWIWRRKNA